MIKRIGKFVEIFDYEKLLVAGDIHGDYESFQRIIYVFKKERKECFKVILIFLGDYADRGNNGLEVIEGLRELKEEYPENVVALKGNHEDYDENGNPKFRPCDLIYEVTSKRGSWSRYFEENLKDFFDSLILAAKCGSYLFLHGGVSSKIRKKEDLISPSKEIERDVIWSDPFEGYGEYPNPRGAGVLFGKDITDRVLKILSANKLVRSHEPQKASNGIYREHDGKVITISSTRVYGGKPAILEICGEKETIRIL